MPFSEVTFLARERCVIRNASASLGVCCQASKQLHASLKKQMSGFIWCKFMIRTLKLSSLDENIVCQCFLLAPFSQVTFLARESCFIRNASASRCLLSFEASKQLLQ